MKTYDFNDILALAHRYGVEQNLAGKQLSVGLRQEENAFSPGESYGALILIEPEGYRILTEIGTQPQKWSKGMYLRVEGEEQKGGLVFEVSPEGHLRFLSAESPTDVSLFTFRHNQELLESSSLALTLLQAFTEQSDESEVSQFAVELRSIVSETFLYAKGEDGLYLSDEESALPALTQAILDSYFEKVVVHVSGFNSPEERVFEREWVLEKGVARDEEGQIVDVPDDVIESLQKAAEEQGKGVRGRVDPALSDDERKLLDAVFDSSLEEMSLLTLVSAEHGPVMETFVDSVSSGEKTHLFVNAPEVLHQMAQIKSPVMVILASRLVDGETVTRAFATEDLHELSEDELNAM